MERQQYVGTNEAQYLRTAGDETGRIWTDGLSCCVVLAAALSTTEGTVSYMQHYWPSLGRESAGTLASSLRAIRRQSDVLCGQVVVAHSPGMRFHPRHVPMLERVIQGELGSQVPIETFQYDRIDRGPGYRVRLETGSNQAKMSVVAPQMRGRGQAVEIDHFRKSYEL